VVKLFHVSTNQQGQRFKRAIGCCRHEGGNSGKGLKGREKKDTPYWPMLTAMLLENGKPGAKLRPSKD